MCGQHVRQRLHGGIKRHAIALVLEQRIQTAQHQGRPPGGQQQPGRVLLAGGDVFVGALLVEGGHTVSWRCLANGCSSSADAWCTRYLLD